MGSGPTPFGVPFLTALLAIWPVGAARAEWVVSGYLGAARTGSASLRIVQGAADTDVTLASVQYRGRSFASPLYYGGRVTWFPRPRSWFGVDAEFIHLKAYAETDRLTEASGRLRGAPMAGAIAVGSVVDRFSISHGLNCLLFNAVARHAFGSRGAPGRIAVSARIGAGPTIPHAESTIDGRTREGYAWGALGWQAAAGVQVRLLRRVELLGEYKFTRTRETLDIDRGTARGVFASHHVVFGLGWRL